MARAPLDQRHIVQFGIQAAADCLAEIRTVWQLTRRHDPDRQRGWMMPDPEIKRTIAAVCATQSTAYSCLFDNGRRSTENERYRQMRLARVEGIRQLCRGLDLSEISKRGIRNALAHFDERFLKAIVEHPNGGWVSGLAMGYRDQFRNGPEGDQRLINVYVIETDDAHLFGETLNLGRLDAQIRAVLKRLGVDYELPTEA